MIKASVPVMENALQWINVFVIAPGLAQTAM
jgi:hypothetical protein